MRSLSFGFALWLLKMAVLLGCFAGAAVVVAHCQNKIVTPPYISHPDHENLEDMESDIRFKSIYVISTEPFVVYWKKESKLKVDVGSFNYDDRSRVNKVIQKGCYVALYCITHDYLYALYPCKE